MHRAQLPLPQNLETTHVTLAGPDHRRVDATSDTSPWLGADVRVSAALGPEHTAGPVREHSAGDDDHAMDAAGVRLGLVSAWWGARGSLIDNDEVAALVRERPDRLIGVASVDLARPMAAVRELRRTVRELGFRALRILPWLWNLPPDDRRYYPLYAECIEHDIPFCLQVGHTGPLAPSEPGRPIPYLDHVALDFPDLRIVGGHIGFPWTSEMISLATKYPNVHIDTSAYKVRRYPPELVEEARDGRK